MITFFIVILMLVTNPVVLSRKMTELAQLSSKTRDSPCTRYHGGCRSCVRLDASCRWHKKDNKCGVPSMMSRSAWWNQNQCPDESAFTGLFLEVKVLQPGAMGVVFGGKFPSDCAGFSQRALSEDGFGDIICTANTDVVLKTANMANKKAFVGFSAEVQTNLWIQEKAKTDHELRDLVVPYLGLFMDAPLGGEVGNPPVSLTAGAAKQAYMVFEKFGTQDLQDFAVSLGGGACPRAGLVGSEGILKRVFNMVFNLQKHGILHGDAHLGNLRTNADGVLKWIDFGQGSVTRLDPDVDPADLWSDANGVLSSMKQLLMADLDACLDERNKVTFNVLTILQRLILSPAPRGDILRSFRADYSVRQSLVDLLAVIEALPEADRVGFDVAELEREIPLM